LVAFLVFRLPETKPPHLENMDLKTMFIHYYQVGRDGKLWLYSIIWGITSGIIFTFSAIMPLISQNSLHLPADVFSTYNLWVFAGLAVGNILSAKLAVFFNPKKIMIMGIIVSLSGAILFLISTLSSHLTAAHLFLWNTLLFLGLPAIFCNALALATARSSDTATASSLITSIDLCVAILVLSSMSLFTNHMAAMMSGLFVIMLISVTLLFYWVGRR
jgi:predicted MFS family arabinose efflux permease